MARNAAKRADDRVIAQKLARRAHPARAVGQMHPVQPVMLGEGDVVVDDDSHVMFMRNLAREIRDPAQFGFVSRAAEAQAGDRQFRQSRGEHRSDFLGCQAGGCDQVKLWKIGLCHMGGFLEGVCPDITFRAVRFQYPAADVVKRKPPLQSVPPRANARPMTQNPVVILVRPQMGENIGAAARAMLNFGLTELRLVAPRDGWPNPKAVAMASGAAGRVLDHAKVYDDLAGALEGLDAAYATTARGRDLIKPVYTPSEAMGAARAHTAQGGRVALVFGAERSGLENEDIALATAIVTVPVNPEFASLNLAQAVLLMGYEWGREALPSQPAPHGRRMAGDVPASLVEIDALARHYEEKLDAAGFFFPEQKAVGMKLTLRNMWSRLGMTRSDTEIFHGMLRRLARRD